MEANYNSLLFSFFFLLSLSISSSFELQTLVLTSLPHSPSINLERTWIQPQLQEETAQLESSREPSVTFRLEHIDALTPHLSPNDLFSLRLKRDASRVEHLISRACGSRHNYGSHRARNFTGFTSSVVAGHGSGEYFTRLGIGTPPRFMYMILDTGSDVNWIQCQPCRSCYNQTDPIFNPAKSSSYRSIPCRSNLCRQLDQPGCAVRKNRCTYKVSYGDGSSTVGEFATEMITSKGIEVHDVALGCGLDNEGLFVGAAGLLALSLGKLSFSSQIGKWYGDKFSYCLADQTTSTKPSWILFGQSAVPHAAVFTPLIINPKLDTFYYVELVGISVGGVRVRGITPELFKIDHKGEGGVVVDSGTSVTRFTQPAYVALRDAFRAQTSKLKSASMSSLLDTCYDLSRETKVSVPTVVMHFKGADLSLPSTNILIPVSSSGEFCFAFAGTTSKLSIIGNIQQQGFRVVFDVVQRRVGFAPGACA